MCDSGFGNSFKGCNKITNLIVCGQSVNVVSQTIDLSECTSLTSMLITYSQSNWILPASLKTLTYAENGRNFDGTNCTNLTSISTNQNNINTKFFENFKNSPLKDVSFFRDIIDITGFEKLVGAYSTLQTIYIGNDNWGFYSGGFSKISGDCNSLANFKNLKSLNISYYKNKDIINGVFKLTSLEKLNLNNNNIGNISEISNLTNLKELNLYSNNISDISVLSNLKNLTYLHLYANNISNLKPLESLIVNGKTNLQTLYLNNNTLENYTTQNINGQVNSINNIEILKKLHDAGLKNVNIAGNNFQDTSDLKKLTWTSYAE